MSDSIPELAVAYSQAWANHAPEAIVAGTRDGKSFACDGTDVFTVSDGLVARKDSYLDWITYQQQTGVDVTSVSEFSY